MCGIAGLIYRNGSTPIGEDMARMLQSMKHRGPDSTGYALYRPPSDDWVMHVKLADVNAERDFEFDQRIRRNRAEVRRRPRPRGRGVLDTVDTSPHAMTVTFSYDGDDLKALADRVEDIRGAEVLSLGHTLEIVKDIGDAQKVAGDYGLQGFHGTHGIGHVRMATESDVDISGAHPVLGLSVLRRRGRPQRPAHELPPVAPAAGARRAPLPVRVRLGDHRRLPRRADGRRRHAGGGDAPQPLRARRRLHLPLP